MFESNSLAVCLVLALIADWFLGEPRRFHPLVGFGTFATKIEKWLNTNASSRKKGLLAWLLAVLPFLLVTFYLAHVTASLSPWLAMAFNSALLYLCIGHQSLIQHANWIYEPLSNGDIAAAREKVAWIVSRDTASMDNYQISSATIESVLENGNDAIFGTLFWFLLLGAPGAILFRLANTLDAMWGYKNPRFFHFGFAAARLDDALGFIPARLTALSYAMLGNTRNALQCWRAQAKHCKSPNGGPVMTSGAGALEITIGGPAIYHGQLQDKRFMGSGEKATAQDIAKACSLVSRTCVLWAGCALAFIIVVG
jgi:adenosylcobinamide-phosphate synthase